MPLIRIPIGADGPVIGLEVWIGRRAAHALIAQGQSVPKVQTVRALIDTGADRTALHPGVMSLIGSAPIATARIRRPGSQAVSRRVNLHDVRLALGGAPAPSARANWIELEAAAVVPADPHVLALIGRDMLASCQFVYDGPKGELILIF